MSKTYSVGVHQNRDYATAKAFNQDASGFLAEFNGKLDAQQLPYETIDDSNMVANSRIAVDSRPDGSAQDGVGVTMATQSYFQVESTLNTFTWARYPAADVLGPPLATFSSQNNSWASGILSLSANITRGSFLRIPTSEGFLRGAAQIDVEYFFVSQEAAGFTGNFGAGWRWQFYVFVNDVMVSTTGEQPAGRRRTVNLPFAAPIASQDSVTIDVRWSATFDGAGTSPANIKLIEDANLRVYNCLLWARNQYR